MFGTANKRGLTLIAILCFLVFLFSCGNYSDEGGPAAQNSNGNGDMSAEGLVLPTALQITTDPTDQSQPDVAYDDLNNRYLVVYTDARNNQTTGLDIYGQLVDPNGNLVSSEVAINTGTGDQIQPKVAYDGNLDKYLVVWTDVYDQHIHGQFLTNGAPPGPDGGSFIVSQVNPSDYVNSNVFSDYFALNNFFDVGWQNTPAGAPELIGVGTSTQEQFSLFLSQVAHSSSEPSTVPGSVRIYEDGALVGQDVGGSIIGSRSGNAINGESMGTGDGSSIDFTNILSNAISPQTLAIKENGVVVAVDDGAGKLIDYTGGRIDTVNSSVTYATGKVTLLYTAAKGVTGETITRADGSTSYNGTLSQFPVTSGTVTIYNGTEEVAFDQSGGFVAIASYFNAGGSTINYSTGDLTLAFNIAPTSGSYIKADYTVAAKAPANGVALTADYFVPGYASLFTGASYIDYQTGYLFLQYTAGAAPNYGVQLTVGYEIGTNAFDIKDVNGDMDRSIYSSQQSPAVVYDPSRPGGGAFLVAWLDNSNEDIDYFHRLLGDGLCSNDFSDGIVDANDGSNDADIFSFKFIDKPGYVGSNMIRYRVVSYADATDGTDSDLVYDSDLDGTLDAGDGSSVDGPIITASSFQRGASYSITSDVTTCTSSAESWTVSVDFNIKRYEGDPAISYDPANGNAVLAWTEKPETLSQTYKWSRVKQSGSWTGWTYTESGTVSVSPNSVIESVNEQDDWVIFDGPAGALHSHPDLVPDPYNKSMLVVWESQESNDKNIYGHKIGLQGFDPVEALINISTVQYDQSQPKVAFDPVNQRYMVIWEDARNTATNISNIDVYGQFIDPQGQLSGSNSPITSNTSNQIAPALAFGDNDATRFLIAWKDGRSPGDANIFGQIWEWSVAPQLLLTDNLDVPLYQQTIAFGGVLVNQESFKTFRIWNLGNAPLVLNSVAAGANVYLGTNSTYPFNIINPLPLGISNSISPGSYYEVQVRFLTNTASTYSGADNSIDIITNGGSNTLYFSAYGIGTNPQITTTALPNAAVGIYYSFLVAGSGGTTPYTWSATGLPSSGADPLTINPTTGAISGTPDPADQSAVPYDVQVTLTDSSGKFTTVGYQLVVSNMAVTTTGLINAPVNTALSVPLGASGGSPPYTWAITAGALPPGLSMSTSGLITGTPTSLGLYDFTVEVTDSASIPNSATQDLQINVYTSLEITIPSDVNLPDGSELAPYDVTLDAKGGPQDLYVWSVDPVFHLPPGLSLNPITGRLSGSPSSGSQGSYKVRIFVTDVNGVQAERVYGMNITDVVITTQSLSNPVEGVYYTAQLAADGGTPPYAWTSTALPPGSVGLSTSGLLSGTFTQKGVYPVTFYAKDENGLGSTGAKTFIIIVTDITFSTTSPLPPATTNTYYSTPIDIAGGTANYNWSLIGNVPAGFGIVSPAAGTPAASTIINGTAAHSGTYDFTVRVTDATATQASLDLTLTIVSDLLINAPSPLPIGQVDAPYVANVTASGGISPYEYALGFGTIPPGLTLGSNGRISGTPTTEGPYSFSVIVTDSDGEQNSKVFDLNVQTAAGTEEDTGSGDSGTTNNEACYIATAAYGSYLDPHVQALRDFRDNVLRKSAIGRELVELYYRTSPPVAEFIRKHEALRTVARITLTPVVYGVAYPGLGFAMIFGTGAFGTLWWRRRRNYALDKQRS